MKKPKIRKDGNIWLCSEVLTFNSKTYGRYHINWGRTLGKGKNPTQAYEDYLREEKRINFRF